MRKRIAALWYDLDPRDDLNHSTILMAVPFVVITLTVLFALARVLIH